MEVVPVIVGCLCGGVEKTGNVEAKLIEGERNVIRTVKTIQQTVVLEGETIVRKVLSGIIQLELALDNVSIIGGNVLLAIPLFSLELATNHDNDNDNSNNNNKNPQRVMSLN